MRQADIDRLPTHRQHGLDVRLRKEAGGCRVALIGLERIRIEGIVSPIQTGDPQRLMAHGDGQNCSGLEVMQVTYVTPAGLDLRNRRGPIVVAVDPIDRAGQGAIMAHIAYLQHDIAIQAGDDILKIGNGRLSGRFKPAMDVAEDRYPHR